VLPLSLPLSPAVALLVARFFLLEYCYSLQHLILIIKSNGAYCWREQEIIIIIIIII
jgi:hypothetical protein